MDETSMRPDEIVRSLMGDNLADVLRDTLARIVGELHAPYALPRDTAGQGKTACHRVDDRRST